MTAHPPIICPSKYTAEQFLLDPLRFEPYIHLVCEVHEIDRESLIGSYAKGPAKTAKQQLACLLKDEGYTSKAIGVILSQTYTNVNYLLKKHREMMTDVRYSAYQWSYLKVCTTKMPT